MVKYLKMLFPTFFLFRVIMEEDRDFGKLGKIHFSFRDGFSDRLTARLENIIEKENSPEIVLNLSSLLPKLSMACVGILVVFALVLIYLNGGLEPNALFGTEKIDESNFISYLILQK